MLGQKARILVLERGFLDGKIHGDFMLGESWWMTNGAGVFPKTDDGWISG